MQIRRTETTERWVLSRPVTSLAVLLDHWRARAGDTDPLAVERTQLLESLVGTGDKWDGNDGPFLRGGSLGMTGPVREPFTEDSKDLASWGVNGFVIGVVDEANGPGAVAIPDFGPCQQELRALLTYWVDVRMRIYFFGFLEGRSGSTEIRLGPFADRRIDRIWDVLGEEEGRKAFDEAVAAFREKQTAEGREDFDIYLSGTEEQRAALQNRDEQAERSQWPAGTGLSG